MRGESLPVQEIFSQPIFETINSFVGNAEVLVIDEAQKIDNIGQSLKLLFDTRPLPILVSGSASFDLANKLAEPMTGRATFFTLYPLSLTEAPAPFPNPGIKTRLDDYLRFGMYPIVHTLTAQAEKEEYLLEVIDTYLHNDLLTFREIRKPKKILDLLALLAHQIGSEACLDELARNLFLDWQTVEKYLDVLEKMFVIINLRGLSRNLRKEISKTSKYYFYDVGVRNAIIRNFNPLSLRNDVGGLFENFCILERMKFLANQRKFANFYFWRTYDQKEIDLIEERDGKLRAFEFKYGPVKISKATQREFLETYPGSEFEVVTPENLLTFVS